jgi:hypothetical protein
VTVNIGPNSAATPGGGDGGGGVPSGGTGGNASAGSTGGAGGNAFGPSGADAGAGGDAFGGGIANNGSLTIEPRLGARKGSKQAKATDTISGNITPQTEDGEYRPAVRTQPKIEGRRWQRRLCSEWERRYR